MALVKLIGDKLMKYLIRSDFKAMRKGDFVTANEKAGEFVYVAGSNALTTAQVLEIATANKLQVSKNLKKNEAAAKLDELLETLKLDEVKKMTDTAIVEEVCAAGHAAGKSDDEMLIEIVSRGVKFALAGKLFRQVMEAKGFRVSNKDRVNKAEELLEGIEFDTAEAVEATVANLVKTLPDTNEKQAKSILRKFAKANEIELPKAEKGTKKSAGGFRPKLFKWMIAHPTATAEQLTTYVTDLGKKEAVAKRYAELFDVAKKMAAALAK